MVGSRRGREMRPGRDDRDSGTKNNLVFCYFNYNLIITLRAREFITFEYYDKTIVI